MRYVVEMGPGAGIDISTSIKTGSAIRKLKGEGFTDIQRAW
jgi:hypothetical protein